MKKELIQLLKGKNAYIQTHDFPDPDALATAFALQEYLKYYGIEANHAHRIVFCNILINSLRKKNGLVGIVRTKMYLCHSEILIT